MKRFLLVGLTLCMVTAPALCTSAVSSHPNYKGEVIPITPVTTWTGFYIGANLGGKWVSFSDIITINAAPAVAGETTTFTDRNNTYTNNPVSAMGVQVGYDIQYQRIVFGVIGDWDATGLNVTRTLPLGFVSRNFEPGDFFTVRNNWEASVRARLGYALNTWLFYLTGGASSMNVKVGANYVPTTFDGKHMFSSTGSSTKTLLGWTVGAGGEFQFMNHLSIAAEYRYARYGSSHHRQTFSLCNLSRFGVKRATHSTVWMHTNELLAKLNYKFY